MRVIDADNLLTAFPKSEDEVFHTSAVRGTINACQTVEAVPVAWLKEKLTGHPELSYSVTDAIQNVLDLWEVEHGRLD